jgi:hypothetical protein
MFLYLLVNKFLTLSRKSAVLINITRFPVPSFDFFVNFNNEAWFLHSLLLLLRFVFFVYTNHDSLPIIAILYCVLTLLLIEITNHLFDPKYTSKRIYYDSYGIYHNTVGDH